MTKYLLFTLTIVLGFIENASAQSLWDMHPHEVRDLINQKILGIESERPEVQNVNEGKFPLPLEQCYDALLWINENAQKFHGERNRLAVVGDSAGGNMAAALCLLTRDRQGPNIDLQVLVNPSPDLTGGGTIQRQGDSLDTLRWYATQYVSDPSDANDPYVSPIMAKSLSNLPPAVIILAENDALRNDGQKYADRLIAAGTATNIYIQWGIGHLAGNGARASRVACESLDIASDAIKGAFFRKASYLNQLKQLDKFTSRQIVI